MSRSRRRRRTPMATSWMNIAMLAAESQQVIWLRLLKLAAGGAAASHEAERMTSEKVFAAAQAAQSLLLGASANKLVSAYRKKVKANAKRLLR